MENRESYFPARGQRIHRSNLTFSNHDDHRHFSDSTQSLPTGFEYKSFGMTDAECARNKRNEAISKQNGNTKTQFTSSDKQVQAKLKSPPKKRWSVTYDNQNYIKSQLSKEVISQLVAEKKKAIQERNKIFKVHVPGKDERD